ncbi:ATP-binding protein [Tropicimonas aquimaris]|uniref:ATP-binding protein n=1 Tax=Tropicimonas aquimaris TaxID=914152 RepID=A0ABW3IVK2_9RHOB
MERRRASGTLGPSCAGSATPGAAASDPTPSAPGLPAECSGVTQRPCRGCLGYLHEIVGDTPNDVRRALRRIVRSLALHGLSAKDCVDAELVLAEIMNNVVEHSYLGPISGVFSVEIAILTSGLNVVVEDDGAPMPNLRLPASHPHDLSVELNDLPEGGFGWLMIRELAKDLHYEHHKGRNRLQFRLETSS